MPYKFTPEYSILSSIRKELDPVKELASSAEKLAKSSEERSHLLLSKKAKKADIKGWIAVTVSVLTFIMEICDRLGLF